MPEPRDVTAATVDVGGRSLRFVAPRDPDALPNEEDEAAGEAYPPHWARAWPSGIELAHAVSGRSWAGASVVELGCGLGLPAVAAALGGATVLATDRSADALAFAAANAARNEAVLETAVCRWADADAVVARGPWQVVLAADVLYGQRNVDELLELLPRLVDGDGEVWIADPRRPLTGSFLAAVRSTWRRVQTEPTRNPEIDLHRLSGAPQPHSPRTGLSSPRRR